MRMVIEVTDSERVAIRKFCSANDATYSSLFRALFRLALTGGVKKTALDAELAAPRAEINVTLHEQPKAKDPSLASEREARREQSRKVTEERLAGIEANRKKGKEPWE